MASNLGGPDGSDFLAEYQQRGHPSASLSDMYDDLMVSAILPGSFTIDTLPAAADNVDRYARVTDLFGEKRDLVLASRVGSEAFWQPIRPQYAKVINIASANATLTSLKSPSVIVTIGTLLANRTITLSNTLAYPGASFEVGYNGTLGIFGVTIKNEIGSTLASLISGGRKRYFFADGNWQDF